MHRFIALRWPLLAVLPLLGCAAASPGNLASTVTGQDCARANLEQGLPFCQARAAPEPPPFCTQSRGSVDCWRQPPVASPPYRGLADAAPPPPESQRARPGWRWN